VQKLFDPIEHQIRQTKVQQKGLNSIIATISIHWKVGAFSSSHQLHLTSLSPYLKMCENCGSFATKKKLD
jgi:arginine/lysine/ornithine decarboxylase